MCRVSADGTTGECSVVCSQSDRDCADGQACVSSEDFGFCVGHCATDEDCPGGDVCTIGGDEDEEEQPVQYCSNPVGDNTTGESCETDADCESAICLSNVLIYDGSEGCTDIRQCPSEEPNAECGCPPTEPDCSEDVCYRFERFCSEVCDPANGDADCENGDHRLTRCGDVRAKPSDQYVSMCTPSDD